LVRSGVSDSEQKRQLEEKFLQDRGIALEPVARLSLSRMLKNPSRIVIGLDYHLFDLIVRVSPGLASHVMRVSSRRAGF
jgi:hypothetical protein